MYLTLLLSTEETERKKLVSNLKDFSVKWGSQTRKHLYHNVMNIVAEEWKRQNEAQKKEYVVLSEKIRKSFSEEQKS